MTKPRKYEGKFLSQWSIKTGVPVRTLRSRIARGMSLQEAISAPHGNTIHGNAQEGKRTREYRSWIDLRSRCKYSYRTGYHNYGGRGIRVCKRWLLSFENFLDDVGPAPSPKHEIDRINTNGNYTPKNVRWVTHQENCLNRRPR